MYNHFVIIMGLIFNNLFNFPILKLLDNQINLVSSGGTFWRHSNLLMTGRYIFKYKLSLAESKLREAQDQNWFHVCSWSSSDLDTDINISFGCCLF